MCDTMVCLPSVTKSGKMIFAKNSDRSPNEPHIIERLPAMDYNLKLNPKVKTTYIEVDQVAHTYSVTLFKPSWIWGAEMGFNEYSVNIGNEAVFTKGKYGRDGLTGMDLLRLALERSKTAYEALMCITGLLEKYGQGGNCGYQKNFFYDNSFLIADKFKAYVLETAGKYWVAKKVSDIYTISNGLTIEGDFDYAHPDVLAARARNSKYSFIKKFREPIFTFFSESKGRRNCSDSMLRAEINNITVETVMNVLRSHKDDRSNCASVGSVCMHAGGPIGDSTTGSYIGEIGEHEEIYYATGASMPCMSVYKPLLKDYVKGDCTNNGIIYWADREMLSRYFLSGQADINSFAIRREKLEQDMFARIVQSKNKEETVKIVQEITVKEQELIDEFLNPLKGVSHIFTLGKSYYKKYWSTKTLKLIEDQKIKYK